MGRLPKVHQNSDTSVVIRASIPGPIWKVAQELGRGLGIATRADPGFIGLKLILDQISALFENGDAKFLGAAMFENALARVRGQNMDVLARDIDKIELHRLHMSERLKSGFVGVYAYGPGFRAMGKTLLGHMKVIATCKTAEEAAWRRYLYYKQNNLPYGPLEEEMERWRKDGGSKMGCKGFTDDQLIAAIEDHAKLSGRYDELFKAPNTLVPKRSSKLPIPAIPNPIIEPHESESEVVIGFEDGDLPESLQ